MNTQTAEIQLRSTTGREALCREILQSLRILYATQAGELALDRDYGIDGGCIGYPMEQAKALLTAELVRKTARYVPGARVARVQWNTGADGTLMPKVVIELV